MLRHAGAGEIGPETALTLVFDASVEAEVRPGVEATAVSCGGRLTGRGGGRLNAILPSPVAALRCALAIQRRLAAEGTDARAVRIGIDLLSMEANAERPSPGGRDAAAAGAIEDLAHPGGICISGPVYMRVRTRFDVAYDALGPRRLAGRAEPVAIYRVLSDAASGGREIGIHPDRAKLFKWVGVAGFVVLFAFALRPLLVERASREAPSQALSVAGFEGWDEAAALRTALVTALAAGESQAVGASNADAAFQLEGALDEAAPARVTVRLVDVRSGEVLWRGAFERTARNPDAIAVEIAKAARAALASRDK